MCVIFFLCSLLFVSPCWISCTSGERGGRNQRHGHWLLSEHICLPAVHMFTPDPGQVTVWVAPSLFPSRYLHPPPPPLSLPKVFLPTVEETLQPRLKWATTAVLSVSPQSHTRHQLGPGRGTANSENWLDSKVIKAIKANGGYWKKGII